MSAPLHTDYLSRRLSQTQAIVEQWQVDHLNATVCHDVELLLRDTAQMFNDILDADARNQTEFLAGRSYDAGEEMAALMRLWVAVAEAGDAFARHSESRGYAVEHAETVRSQLREARAMLAPSDEMSDAMVALRDQAVEDHRAGRSEAMS